MRELDWHQCYSKNLKGIISNEAFSHPAKFAYGLIVRIYAHLLERGWLQEGDLVTDPFAGVGVGGIVAAAHGLRWIGIELEQKFVDLTVGFECDGVVERHQERDWIEAQPSGWFVRLRIKAQYWDASGESSLGGPKGDGWGTEQEAQAFADSIADSEEVQGYPLSTLHWEPVEGHYATKWVCDKPAKCGSCEPHDPHHVTGSFELHREQWDKMGKPLPIILQGDSRHFSSIIREGVDSILTSPPYARSLDDGHPSNLRTDGTSFTYGFETPGQIGAMKEGKQDEVVEGIVTSAPYADSMSSEKSGIDWSKCKREDGRSRDMTKEPAHATRIGAGGEMQYSSSPDNLGNLPEGDFEEVVDGVVTSAPYVSGGHHPDQTGAWGGKRQSVPKELAGYGKTEGQVGRMSEGDHEAVVNGIVTSPPWEEAQSGGGIMKDGYVSPLRPDLPPDWISQRTYAKDIAGQTSGQISNEQGDTYWQAVARVYSECFKALKPNGIMCVVVKDFVRNKKRMPLCSQTLELLQAIGFKPLERIRAWVVSEAEQKSLMPELVKDYRKARKSFFRRLAERKGSPKIDWEEVLICQKAD